MPKLPKNPSRGNHQLVISQQEVPEIRIDQEREETHDPPSHEVIDHLEREEIDPEDPDQRETDPEDQDPRETDPEDLDQTKVLVLQEASHSHHERTETDDSEENLDITRVRNVRRRTGNTRSESRSSSPMRTAQSREECTIESLELVDLEPRTRREVLEVPTGDLRPILNRNSTPLRRSRRTLRQRRPRKELPLLMLCPQPPRELRRRTSPSLMRSTWPRRPLALSPLSPRLDELVRESLRRRRRSGLRTL